jgi:N-acetylmuramoyl-L-alanine amidase
MARKLFLSAGHGGSDTGAVSGSYIERDLTIEQRNLLTAELKALGINPLEDDDRNALKQTLAWLRGKFGSSDILIDLHFNAGSLQSHGTEIVVPDSANSFEKAMAYSLLKVYTDLGFYARGVIPESLTARKKLGWMRPSAENILIETCFITNVLDMKLYEANKQTIAKRLALVIKDYINKP